MAVLAHFIDVANNQLGQIFTRLLVICIAHISMFAIPASLWPIIRRYIRPARQVFPLGFLLAIGIIFRAWILAELLFYLEITPVLDLRYRMSIAVISALFATTLIWSGYSSVYSHHERRRDLLSERNKLLLLEQSLLQSASQFDSSASENIRRSVFQSLALEEIEPADVFLTRLRSTSDDIVRPLSHALLIDSKDWKSPVSPNFIITISWREVIRSAADPQRIHPKLLLVFLSILSAPSNFINGGLQYGILGLLTFLIAGPPIILGAKKLAIAVSRGRSEAIRIFAFIVILPIAGLLLGACTLIYTIGYPNPYQYIIEGPLSVLLLTAIFAVLEISREKALAIENDLLQNTEDLQWMIARAREQHRQNERALAHALHGRLQAVLASAIIRIEQSISSHAQTTELIAGIKKELRETITNLNMRDLNNESVKSIINLIQNNWAGVSEIDFKLSDETEEALLSDPLCLGALNDLLPELIFNAIRHGKAPHITVSVELNDSRRVEVEVIDDGSFSIAADRNSVGTKLLDEATISWSRERQENETVVHLLLPIVTNALLPSQYRNK